MIDEVVTGLIKVKWSVFFDMSSKSDGVLFGMIAKIAGTTETLIESINGIAGADGTSIRSIDGIARAISFENMLEERVKMRIQAKVITSFLGTLNGILGDISYIELLEERVKMRSQARVATSVPRI